MSQSTILEWAEKIKADREGKKKKAYASALKSKEEKNPKKSYQMQFVSDEGDTTIMEGENIDKLKKEVNAFEELTGAVIVPKEKETVDEAEKRKKWLQRIVSNEKDLKATVDVPGDTTKQLTLSPMGASMLEGENQALTDSVNFSLGREAQNSPDNWQRFMTRNKEPDTGMTINELAQQKYLEFVRKAQTSSGVVRPGEEESWARDETQRWLSSYLKNKYNIDYEKAVE